MRRSAAYLLWLGLCASGLVALAREWPFPTGGPDCAPRLRAELESFRAALPHRSVIFYVGPELHDGCSPYYLAQHALAPSIVLEPGRAESYLAWRDHDLVVPLDPAVVLAFGPAGRRWLRERPEYLPARRAGEAVLAVRR